MSVLLSKLRRTDPTAASVLERADLRTDLEIRSLTREDLHELFPGPENLKLRRIVFGITHKRKPINRLLKDLYGLTPHDSLRAAPPSNVVLVDYLHILKDMRTHLNNVQTFLNAHISLLEGISKAPPEEQGRGVLKSPSTSSLCSPMDPCNRPGEFYPYKAQVMYQMVVSGNTFDAHLQLMAKVQAQVQDRVQLISCSEEGQIVIAFCPVTSRAGPDLDAAMTHVTGDEPVILVLMHHTLEVKPATSRRTWSHCSNIVLHVDVFYHETVRGLLRCQENDAAASWIRDKLLEYSVPGNKWAVTSESNSSGNDRASHFGSEFGFRLFSSGSSSSSSSSSDSCSKSIWEPSE